MKTNFCSNYLFHAGCRDNGVVGFFQYTFSHTYIHTYMYVPGFLAETLN